MRYKMTPVMVEYNYCEMIDKGTLKTTDKRINNLLKSSEIINAMFTNMSKIVNATQILCALVSHLSKSNRYYVKVRFSFFFM